MGAGKGGTWVAGAGEESRSKTANQAWDDTGVKDDISSQDKVREQREGGGRDLREVAYSEHGSRGRFGLDGSVNDAKPPANQDEIL